MRTRPSGDVPAVEPPAAGPPLTGQATAAALDAGSAAACPFSTAATSGITRRGALAGAALLATAPLLGEGLARPAAAQAGLLGTVTTTTTTVVNPLTVAPSGIPLPGTVKWKHAVGDPRGSRIVALYGSLSEARFGRMFKDLPNFSPADALLSGLAAKMTEDRDSQPDIVADFQDNFAMPSGFVYFGQFVDHDITHDTTPLSAQASDPDGVTNYDTPYLDLSCLYGRGPLLDPQLYEADGKHLKLVNGATSSPNGLNQDVVSDLPRDSNGIAFVGDPRNDENLIISQMQQAFIMLHNRFLDKEALGIFARAQQLTTWHYQWVIVHDYLPHLVGQDLLDSMIFKNLLGMLRTKNKFYQPTSLSKPYMPIEFSVAAYRWGHSAIRPEYEMREVPDVDPNPSVLPIFNDDTGPYPRDLRGSRPLYFDAQIDWNYFFEIPGVIQPDDRNFARKIDTNVARALFNLPDSVVKHVSGAILALAERNLLRAPRLGCPAGQDVAVAMQQVISTMPPPLTNAQLDPENLFTLADPGWGANGGKAPLWFYILREAELGGGQQLGPVGGRIVAEVILGLLMADSGSYWNQAVPFTPVGGSNFRMGDLLQLAGAPIVQPNCETLGEIGCLVSG